MATVASMSSGTVVDADWSGDILDVTISVGDISNCILFWAGGDNSDDNNDAERVQLLGFLVNTTTLRFKNGSGQGDLDWRILEFDPGEITSQHGEAAYDSTSKAITITTVGSVDDAWCMLMGLYINTGTTYSGDFHGRLEFTNATTLTMVSAGTASDNFAWQVVKYDAAADISCQHGTITLSGVANNTALINAVTLNKTLCFINGSFLDHDTSGNDEALCYGDFSDTTHVRVTRDATTGADAIFAFSVAELSDGETVQTGLMTPFTSGTETAAISAVVDAQSAVFGTFALDAATMGMHSSTSELRTRAQFRLKFNSTTEIQADVLDISGVPDFQWQVCEWPVAAGGEIGQVPQGVFSLTGFDADVLVTDIADIPQGVFSLIGFDFEAEIPNIGQIPQGVFSLEGFDFSANNADPQTAQLPQGAFTLNGFDFEAEIPWNAQIPQGAFILQGFDFEAEIPWLAQVSQGAFTLQGFALDVLVSDLAQVPQGVFSLNGFDFNAVIPDAGLSEVPQGIFSLVGFGPASNNSSGVGDDSDVMARWRRRGRR